MTTLTNAQEQQLLGILQSLAPTGKEQQKLANGYNEAVADNSTPAGGALFLTSMLYLGLVYESWPWTDQKGDGA